jgi:hypothetical protein
VKRLAALAALLALSGCAGSGPPHARPAHAQPVPPLADSVTVGLWRLDENGGTRAEDAGPFRLPGTAGGDTHTDFGRYRGARVFQRANDSWVYVPWNPAMDTPQLTVEAWIQINSIGPYELQVIAARWTPVANQQAWALGVGGSNFHYPAVPANSPGWFTPGAAVAPSQRLVFEFQPAAAGGPRMCWSTSELPLQRWVHVAATVDGEVIRLYVNGRLDAQVEAPGTVRAGQAPLLIGSAIDPRHLTTSGTSLRIDPSVNDTPFYAFDGSIDELRLSSTARTRFESAALQ